MQKTDHIGSKKTILITGASGFLGSALALYFSTKSYKVIGVVRNKTQGMEVRNKIKPHNIQIIEMPHITLHNLCTIKGKIDCVIHCAGGSSVNASFQDPQKDYMDTVDTSVQILEFLRMKHPTAEFIYPSSGAVYGNSKNTAFAIDQKLNPASPYGFHKVQVEIMGSMYHTVFGIRVKIVRFFSLYGPQLHKQIIWDAYKKLTSKGQEAVFRGTGREKRDFLFIEDAVHLIGKLLSVRNSFLIVNGGSGKNTSISRIIFYVRMYVHTKKNIRFDGKICDVFQTRADISNTEKICNWKPSVSIEEGIKKTLREYEKKNS